MFNWFSRHFLKKDEESPVISKVQDTKPETTKDSITHSMVVESLDYYRFTRYDELCRGILDQLEDKVTERESYFAYKLGKIIKLVRPSSTYYRVDLQVFSMQGYYILTAHITHYNDKDNTVRYTIRISNQENISMSEVTTQLGIDEKTYVDIRYLGSHVDNELRLVYAAQTLYQELIKIR